MTTSDGPGADEWEYLIEAPPEVVLVRLDGFGGPPHLLDAFRMTAGNRAVGASQPLPRGERLAWARVADRCCELMREAGHDAGHDLDVAQMRLRANLIKVLGVDRRVELLDPDAIASWTSERLRGESITQARADAGDAVSTLSTERLRRLRIVKNELEPMDVLIQAAGEEGFSAGIDATLIAWLQLRPLLP